MPKVSVIIPTYNRSHYLREAIESVLAQSMSDLEAIVVDDGSTDDTPAVVEAVTDSRIRYLRQSNAGSSRARNIGLATSKGEYIAFLDSDDTYYPHKLREQSSFLDENIDVGLVAGGWAYTDRSGRVLREEMPWERARSLNLEAWALDDCLVTVNSVLVRRSWLDRVGGFDEQLRSAHDWDLWIRLAQAGCRAGWLETVTSTYRMHDSNMVRDAASLKRDSVAVLDKLFSSSGLSPELLMLRPQAYARMYIERAYGEYAAGQASEASADIAHAVELDPRLLANKGKALEEGLYRSAWRPFVPDPIAYAELVWNTLPDQAAVLRTAKGRVLAQLAMTKFYRAYERHEWHTVQRALPWAAAHDPTWLRNRGAIVMWLEATLGSRSVRVLRRIAGCAR